MGLLSRGLAVAMQNKKATLPNCGALWHRMQYCEVFERKKWINAPKCLYLQTEIVRNQLT